jgi:hypothetical protein
LNTRGLALQTRSVVFKELHGIPLASRLLVGKVDVRAS